MDFIPIHREESEIIEGEVVEVQIDRPATTAVSVLSHDINYALFSVFREQRLGN